jgi:hypothetical protein
MDSTQSLGTRAGISIGMWIFVATMVNILFVGLGLKEQEANTLTWIVAALSGRFLWRWNYKMYLVDEVCELRWLTEVRPYEAVSDSTRRSLAMELLKREKQLREKFGLEVPLQ